MTDKKINYLNIGCGSRYNPQWVNIDADSPQNNNDVLKVDLKKGIPFADESFNLVYHSHFLEHLPKEKADFILQECYRVLRPNGIIRVVVPDLETLVKNYLVALEKVRSGDIEWTENYEWILLELFDQMIRNKPGGVMKEYIYSSEPRNQKFLLSKGDSEIKKLIEVGNKKKENQKNNLAKSKSNLLTDITKHIYRFIRYSDYRKNYIYKTILGQEYKYLEIGRFRESGEVHQWMYDNYSLELTLKKVGFDQITQRNAIDSYIKNWITWNLDTELDGTIYKPESLYIEAIKP
jgi:predicted SAM-dependent methyltransferase